MNQGSVVPPVVVLLMVPETQALVLPNFAVNTQVCPDAQPTFTATSNSNWFPIRKNPGGKMTKPLEAAAAPDVRIDCCVVKLA